MFDEKSLFDEPVKNYIRTYDNIQIIMEGQEDYYTTDCLLDYPYFKEYYKIIAIDLSKQQALDIDSKAMQQINFAENLDQDGNNNVFHN